MRKIRLDSETKKILKNFSVFFGMIFGMTVILVTFTLLSRASWRNGLALELQHVLDSYPDAQYTVSKNLRVDSTFSTSAVVYSLLKKDEGKNAHYGVIVRIPSMLGPLPAVFVYEEKSGVVFAGYAIDNGKAGETVSVEIASNVMKYWENMIPQIINKTESN